MPFLGRLLGVLRKTGSQWLKRLPKWVRNKQAEVNQRRLISYIKSVMALFTISLLISFDSPARTFGMPFILSFLVVSALHPGRTMGAHIELSFVMALVTGITTAYLVIVQLIVFSISSNTSYAYPSGARIFRAVALAVGCFFLSTARAYWSRYQGIFNLQAFLVFQVLTIFDDTRNFTLNGIPKTVASMMLGTGITMFWNFAVPDTASHILEISTKKALSSFINGMRCFEACLLDLEGKSWPSSDVFDDIAGGIRGKIEELGSVIGTAKYEISFSRYSPHDYKAIFRHMNIMNTSFNGMCLPFNIGRGFMSAQMVIGGYPVEDSELSGQAQPRRHPRGGTPTMYESPQLHMSPNLTPQPHSSPDPTSISHPAFHPSWSQARKRPRSRPLSLSARTVMQSRRTKSPFKTHQAVPSMQSQNKYAQLRERSITFGQPGPSASVNQVDTKEDFEEDALFINPQPRPKSTVSESGKFRASYPQQDWRPPSTPSPVPIQTCQDDDDSDVEDCHFPCLICPQATADDMKQLVSGPHMTLEAMCIGLIPDMLKLLHATILAVQTSRDEFTEIRSRNPIRILAMIVRTVVDKCIRAIVLFFNSILRRGARSPAAPISHTRSRSQLEEIPLPYSITRSAANTPDLNSHYSPFFHRLHLPPYHYHNDGHQHYHDMSQSIVRLKTMRALLKQDIEVFEASAAAFIAKTQIYRHMTDIHTYECCTIFHSLNFALRENAKSVLRFFDLQIVLQEKRGEIWRVWFPLRKSTLFGWTRMHSKPENDEVDYDRENLWGILSDDDDDDEEEGSEGERSPSHNTDTNGLGSQQLRPRRRGADGESEDGVQAVQAQTDAALSATDKNHMRRRTVIDLDNSIDPNAAAEKTKAHEVSDASVVSLISTHMHRRRIEGAVLFVKRLLATTFLLLLHLDQWLSWPETKYAVKYTISIMIWAIWAYFDFSKGFFMYHRCHWLLLALSTVLSQSAGFTLFLGIYRIIVTAIGALWAVISYLASDRGNHPGLAFLFLALYSIPSMYVMIYVPRLAPVIPSLMIAFVSIFYTSIHQYVPMHIVELAVTRFVENIIGVVFAIMVSWWMWTFRSRRYTHLLLATLFDYIGSMLVQLHSMQLAGHEFLGIYQRSMRKLDHISSKMLVTIAEARRAIADAAREPSLHGPFRADLHLELIKYMEKERESIMNAANATKYVHTDMTRREVRNTAKLRKDSLASILVYMHLMAGTLRSGHPLPPYLPDVRQARLRLTNIVRKQWAHHHESSISHGALRIWGLASWYVIVLQQNVGDIMAELFGTDDYYTLDIDEDVITRVESHLYLENVASLRTFDSPAREGPVAFNDDMHLTRQRSEGFTRYHRHPLAMTPGDYPALDATQPLSPYVSGLENWYYRVNQNYADTHRHRRASKETRLDWALDITASFRRRHNK